MNKTVHATFMIQNTTDEQIMRLKLLELGNDFVQVDELYEWEMDEDANELWTLITGRLDAERASMIKLQDSFLSDRMRISYIADELKDMYRK